MHAKVVNSNPTNYIFLRLAINTLSIEHIKSPFFQSLKIGLECLPLVPGGCHIVHKSEADKWLRGVIQHFAREGVPG